MKRSLLERLEKLEARRSLSWMADFGLLESVARQKLTPEDRADLERIRMETGGPSRTPELQEVWNRWSKAVEEAVQETGFPFRIYASDLWL